MDDSCLSDRQHEVLKEVLLAFGRKIREDREHLGYSQESFARKSGFYRTYIGAIERGEQNFTIDTLLKIARALDADLCSLFNEVCRTLPKSLDDRSCL